GFLGTDIQGSGFDLDIVVHRGAGAYICGEETALIESLEGERGMPRIRPPFPAVAGLYAKPTVVNNVETISTVPHIVRMGGEEYAKLGVDRSTGTRIFSVSGNVTRPGNYEVELGMTFRELIDGLAGGVPEGRAIKFFIPGGASSQWLVGIDEHLDAPLDMDFVQQNFGVMLGSGAIMVFDETVDPVLVAWRLAKFFAHESCGKCTPCREGTGWIEKVLYRMSHGEGRPEDLDLLVSVGGSISPGVVNAPFAQTTICSLGPSAVSAVASLNRYFRDEIEARLGVGAAS
ncbi:MAG: NADH-ubiquinone oxidoreductase-F iron-sulfur binding region domain-containing protein, partial [Actinomycetota bacterium]